MSAEGKQNGLGWTPWALVILTLVILAGTIQFGRQRLQSTLRQQIIDRDGQLFQTVALMKAAEVRKELREADLDGVFDWRADLALEISQLRGIFAIRIYEANGELHEWLPANVNPIAVNPPDIVTLRSNNAVSIFDENYAVTNAFADGEFGKFQPVLTVNVPFFNDPGTNQVYAGYAEFLVDGTTMATLLEELNRDLARQSAFVFTVSGSILAIALFWALRRISKYTDDLRQANNQLALSARTSALGAVTAHLIHGLKSPLSGLHNFVSSQSQDSENVDWDSAVASTRRMQTLINETISVLREEEAGAQYELEIGELLEMVEGRTAALRSQLGVKLKTKNMATGSLDNRNANLISLVLVNLVQNAMQASPVDASVTLRVERTDEGFNFLAQDHGTGLPAHIRENLFQPVTSTKEGGSGLGLAISNQLAAHLGAKLELKETGEQGTSFVLAVPLTTFTEKTRLQFFSGK
ncbi:MAG: sensor histidine kinase [Limisphaerales bacterium]